MPACLTETCQRNKIMGHWVHPICHINENSPKLQRSFFPLCFQQEYHLKEKGWGHMLSEGPIISLEWFVLIFPMSEELFFFPIRSLNHIAYVVILLPLSIAYKLSTALISLIPLWLQPFVYPSSGFYLLTCIPYSVASPLALSTFISCYIPKHKMTGSTPLFGGTVISRDYARNVLQTLW